MAFLLIIHSMSEMYLKFRLPVKKDEPHNLSMLAIIECEICGYLNVWKFLFQGTLRQSTC